MVATFDGALLAIATVLAAALTVGIPVIWSNRRTRATLGQPNGGGSIAGEIARVKDVAATAATAATAALAVSEATSKELQDMRNQLDRHLEIHGCDPLQD